MLGVLLCCLRTSRLCRTASSPTRFSFSDAWGAPMLPPNLTSVPNRLFAYSLLFLRGVRCSSATPMATTPAPSPSRSPTSPPSPSSPPSPTPSSSDSGTTPPVPSSSSAPSSTSPVAMATPMDMATSLPPPPPSTSPSTSPRASATADESTPSSSSPAASSPASPPLPAPSPSSPSRTFNSLFDALSKSRRVHKATSLFKTLKNCFSPDAATYNILAEGWCRLKRTSQALDLLRDMVASGVAPTKTTYNILLHGLFRARQTRQALDFFAQMKRRSKTDPVCAPDVVSYTTVLHALGLSGEISRTREVFDEMPQLGILPNVAAYNALIQVICRKGTVNDALAVFDEMVIKEAAGMKFWNWS